MPTFRQLGQLASTISVVVLLCSNLSLAAEKYQDIYLTDDRVCKACRWEILPKGEVQLTDRQGRKSVVPAKEIIGVDTHPWLRKTLVKSLQGTGLPAKVIVPYAFEDAQDFVCKYCE
jgi:hypothetical protein